MSKPVDIQSVEQWDEILESSAAVGKTIVVEFYAVWNGSHVRVPPQVMRPTFKENNPGYCPKYDELAAQNHQVEFLQVDVDDRPEIVEKFHISTTPTFFAIKPKDVVGTVC
ncbi:Thioredoxin-domain-containing protein [Mycena sanguinolenta]|uniref:Thioredoxin-domain-containing protein n=1 Tax=Mycena sanguinolenta TaxID=230812 RepID=A0A8H6XU55_9AGAR|nr:Thioredoxin-domain-containing protein [Mycena sanguinolenta]